MSTVTGIKRGVLHTLIFFAGTHGMLCRSASSQTALVREQAASQPTFDVVSIRPAPENDTIPTHITNSVRHAYIRAVNVNLKALMEVAYDIPDLRMDGGPEWITKEKFSLEAKADPDTATLIAALSLEQAKQMKRDMLAALLADRFKLKVHPETKDMPAYAMVIAKGGPKLGKQTSGQETASPEAESITVHSGHDSLAILAYELSWRLDRPVIDRTGLQYRQELILSWQDDNASPADSSGPSLLTAMQEQLGLRLESVRAPVPVLLIDHAERPSEN